MIEFCYKKAAICESYPHKGIIFKSLKLWSRYMTDDVPNCVCLRDCCSAVLCVLVLLFGLCLLGVELHIFVGMYVVLMYLCGLVCYNT